MQFDIRNYARNLELKKYAFINEALINEEADALTTLLTGRTGDATMGPSWKTLQTEILGKVNANPPVYTGSFDAKSTDGTALVTVQWKVDEATGVVSYTNTATNLTVSGKAHGGKVPAIQDNPKFAAWADKFGEAMSGMTEDEDAVYALFQEITADSDLQGFMKYWDSKKYLEGNDSWTYIKQQAGKSGGSDANTTIKYWVTHLFSDSEIAKLNSYLSAYSQFRF